jgi:hypothetical protein
MAIAQASSRNVLQQRVSAGFNMSGQDSQISDRKPHETSGPVADPPQNASYHPSIPRTTPSLYLSGKSETHSGGIRQRKP